MEFTVAVSFLEIYLERLQDLLDPKSKTALTIRETPARGVHVAGCPGGRCASGVLQDLAET